MQTKNKNVQEAINILKKEVHNFKTNSFNSREIVDAKKGILGNFFILFWRYIYRYTLYIRAEGADFFGLKLAIVRGSGDEIISKSSDLNVGARPIKTPPHR